MADVLEMELHQKAEKQRYFGIASAKSINPTVSAFIFTLKKGMMSFEIQFHPVGMDENPQPNRLHGRRKANHPIPAAGLGNIPDRR